MITLKATWPLWSLCTLRSSERLSVTRGEGLSHPITQVRVLTERLNQRRLIGVLPRRAGWALEALWTLWTRRSCRSGEALRAYLTREASWPLITDRASLSTLPLRALCPC